MGHSVDDEAIEARVLAVAAEMGVDYEAVWIDPGLAATADFCAAYGYDPSQSGNCIVVASRTEPPVSCACVVRATHRLDVNRRVRKLLGVRRASFASPEATVAITGMQPDGVTPLGLPPDLPVYVDAGLLDAERVVVGGGSRRLKLVLPSAALAALPRVEVVSDLAREPQRE